MQREAVPRVDPVVLVDRLLPDVRRGSQEEVWGVPGGVAKVQQQRLPRGRRGGGGGGMQ